MMLQKTIDSLKDKPKDDKVAVASGIAVSVVLILFAGWAIFFLRNIQKSSQQLELTTGGAQDQFNFTSVKDAQKQLQQTYGSPTQDLQDLQNQSGGNTMQAQQQTVMQQTSDNAPDQFGTPSQ